MSKKKESRFTKKQIEAIRLMTETTIPARANAGYYTDLNAYVNGSRKELNTLLVQAMMGCELKDGKAKFNHRLPKRGEVAEICTLITDFIDRVENAIIVGLSAPQPADGTDPNAGSDMAVPKMDIKINGQVHRVDLIEKVNYKKLKKELFDRDLLTVCMMNAGDCLRLAEMAEKARKKDSRNKMLIAGGIVLVLTGAAVAGVVMYNKHKNHEDDLKVGDEVVDGDIPEIGDGDIPEIDDVPQVDIE